MVTRQDFIRNQEQLCKKRGIPVFMPYNGICWSCGRDIVAPLIKEGLNGGETHMTGCPFCHRSYCD